MLFSAFTRKVCVFLLPSFYYMSALREPCVLLTTYMFILGLIQSSVSGALFHGLDSSYLVYERWSGITVGEISFEFKSTQSDGLLFYMDTNSTSDYYLLIMLRNGDLVFEYLVGDEQLQSKAVISVDDGKWHKVSIERNFDTTVFTCDDLSFEVTSNQAELVFINFSNLLYLGGLPRQTYASDTTPSSDFQPTPATPNFHGTTRNFLVSSFAGGFRRPKLVKKGLGVYTKIGDACEKSAPNYCNFNGVCVAVDDYVKKCQCKLGFFGEFCQVAREGILGNEAYPDDVQITLRGDQFIIFDVPEALEATAEIVTARFRTFQSSGLLLFVGKHPYPGEGDFMQLALRDGAIYYSVNLGSGTGAIAIKPAGDSSYNDGEWHNVMVVREGQKVQVTVDDYVQKSVRTSGDYNSLQLLGNFFVGGKGANTFGRSYTDSPNFIGCLSHVTFWSASLHVAFIPSALGSFLDSKLDGSAPGSNNGFSLGGASPIEQTCCDVPPPIDITFRTGQSFLELPKWRSPTDGTLSFSFRTNEPFGVLLYNDGGLKSSDFFGVELYDGYLYYAIETDQGNAVRGLIEAPQKGRLTDSLWHDVSIIRLGSSWSFRLDTKLTSVAVTGDSLDLEGSLLVGGVNRSPVNNRYSIPRQLWAAQRGFNYIGCMGNFRLNGGIVDLTAWIEERHRGHVDLECSYREQSHCKNHTVCRNGGVCYEGWNRFICKCQAGFTGITCQQESTTYNFEAGQNLRVEMNEALVTDSLEIRFRFRSASPQGCVFSTFSKSSQHTIIVAINQDAKLVVGFSIDGSLRSYTIEEPKVTDMKWHEFTFKAEPDKSLFWIDDQNVIKFSTQLKPGVPTMIIDVIELGSPKTNEVAKSFGQFSGEIQELLINNNKYLDIITMPTFAQFVEATATKVEEDVRITNSVSFRSASACVSVKSLPVSSGELRISFRFRTHYTRGLILYRSVPGGGDFIAVELTETAQIRVVFNSLQGKSQEAKYIDSASSRKLNDNQWHSVSFQRIKESDYMFINNLYVDGSPITVTTGQPGTLELSGPLYVGGVYREVYHLLDSRIQSLDGFIGCLDSLQYNNQPIDLVAADRILEPEVIFTGCPDSPKPTFCTLSPCSNGGKCLENRNGSYCDCGMTTFAGDTCKLESTTYKFSKGFIKFTYEVQGVSQDKMSLRPRSLTSPAKDTLALAFKTAQEEATLFVVHSRSTDEFINVTLRGGQPFVSFRVGREIHYVKDPNFYRGYNDNRRHVLLFERLGPNATLKVDSQPTFSYIARYDNLSIFDDQHIILIGGDRPKHLLTEEAAQIKPWGTDFTGEIMGVYFNKMKLLNAAAYGMKQIEFAGDVKVKPETVPQIHYDRPPLYNDMGTYFFGSVPHTSTDILWPDDKSLCMQTYGADQQICSDLNGYPKGDEILTLDEIPRYPDPGTRDKGGKNSGGKFENEITTLNDDGNPKNNLVESNFEEDTAKVQTAEEALSLRMSTTISGIIIGIVASIVIAILILIFAIYKYKNRTEVAQHTIRIDTIKLDTMNNNNNNNSNTYDSARTHPYSISPNKSIMKNGGGSSAINTLTRASIDHIQDSKEWYV